MPPCERLRRQRSDQGRSQQPNGAAPIIMITTVAGRYWGGNRVSDNGITPTPTPVRALVGQRAWTAAELGKGRNAAATTDSARPTMITGHAVRTCLIRVITHGKVACLHSCCHMREGSCDARPPAPQVQVSQTDTGEQRHSSTPTKSPRLGPGLAPRSSAAYYYTDKFLQMDLIGAGGGRDRDRSAAGNHPEKELFGG